MRVLSLVAAAVVVLGLLAACGVDGAPTPPAETGVSVTGEAAVGVTGRL
jgi:hypothetical protein